MIRASIKNADRLIARMKERLDRLQHMEVPLAMAGTIVRDAAVMRFKNQGGDGVAWVPNKRGGHTGIVTGRLWQSIQVSSVTSTSVTVGTNVKYARWFQEGTGIFAGHSAWTIRPKSKGALAFSVGGESFVRRSVTIKGQPARPFFVVPLPDTERTKINAAFQDWLMMSEAL